MSFLIRHAALFCLMCVVATAVEAAERPNFLWISCEDISPHLGCYGDSHAITPNLDRLASQGVLFRQAYTVTGVCATCRASMISCMYPSTLGNQFMRCAVRLPQHVQLFPQYLRDDGYYCTNSSKTDYNVTGDHGRCWDESSRTAHWRNRREPNQPFFAVFNLTMTHESKVFNYRRPAGLADDEIHNPDEITPPPFHPNTPVSRADWAHYRDNITAMDKAAAKILQQLEEDGLADNTIVFFWGDHGAGLPRGKRWIYNSGTHVPLIVRIPEQFRQAGQGQPGTESAELISLMDLGPTVMHLAGIELPEHVHGRAFLGDVLTPPREYIYCIRDRMDERYDMIRAVHDGRFKYIRNYEPYKPYFQILNFMEQEHTMKEIRRLHAAGELPESVAQFTGPSKPLEELYDLRNDPHEVHNLIDEADARPELKQALERLRDKHLAWIFDTLDTGLLPEPELAARESATVTRFDLLRQPGGRQLLERLLQANRLACGGPDGVDSLLAMTNDDDAAVRYWAAMGIGNLASRENSQAEAMQRALHDSSGSVRVAAARALWRMGRSEEALPPLEAAIEGDDPYLALLAIQVIDAMDEQAAPIVAAVRRLATSTPKGKVAGYPVRIAKYMTEVEKVIAP